MAERKLRSGDEDLVTQILSDAVHFRSFSDVEWCNDDLATGVHREAACQGLWSLVWSGNAWPARLTIDLVDMPLTRVIDDWQVLAATAFGAAESHSEARPSPCKRVASLDVFWVPAKVPVGVAAVEISRVFESEDERGPVP